MRCANPFNDPSIASHYEEWYVGRGRRAAKLETKLLGKLLAGFPNAKTALDIGCGTGYFTRWLASQGLEVVGLDSSLPMLREACPTAKTPFVVGDMLALPFDTRSFDLVVFVTSLEFVADQALALTEASRIARCGLLLGVLNRRSVTTLWYRLSRHALWRSARFFSPLQLRHLIRSSLGKRVQALRWRTTLWPLPGIGDLSLPWGGFIGLAAHLTDAVIPIARGEAR